MNNFDPPSFIDNLIPIKTDIRQQQTAGWTPGPPVRSGLGCVVHADQMIPVAEGISLAADIATPKTAGRYPAVLCSRHTVISYKTQVRPRVLVRLVSPLCSRTADTITWLSRLAGWAVPREIALFISTRRMLTIMSPLLSGVCDGQVVLFGTSYYAIVQPLVAVRKPPALKGFFAYGLDTDYFRHIVMFGGNGARSRSRASQDCPPNNFAISPPSKLDTRYGFITN
jgi:hypothetical protein